MAPSKKFVVWICIFLRINIYLPFTSELKKFYKPFIKSKIECAIIITQLLICNSKI